MLNKINIQVSVISLLLYLVDQSESARILGVFPTPSISHQVAFRPLMKELAKRGHEVTVITTDPEFDPETAPENLTEIDLHDMSYEIWNKAFIESVDGDTPHTQIIKTAISTVREVVEKILTSNEVQEILQSDKKYDLVIAETWVQPTLAVGYHLNATIIQMSSLGGFRYLYEKYGIPTHPLVYPEAMRTKIQNLSLLDKIHEFYLEYQIYKLFIDSYEADNTMIKKVFGDNMLSLRELQKLPELSFMNIHSVWIQNRPLPPSVVCIGGIHQKPPKELPSDLKNYLDSSKNGVIYMSFGTNVDPTLLPPEKIQVFCNVFRQLPYDVIWKWNGESLEGKPDNVRILKWTPQSDLLKHPKIKVFITQAGLQSTDEAITAGVPLIAFPMLGDQYYNAELYEQLGIGVKMDFSKITEDSLKNTIVSVLGNQRYYNAIRRLNGTLYDQPQSPLERAVWWTEYVLRHGGARHLRAHMADVTWTQYLMLDVVVAVLLLIFTSFCILIGLAFKFLFRLFAAKNVKVKKS